VETETSWLFTKTEQTLSYISEKVHTSLIVKEPSYRPWCLILFYHVVLSEKSEYFIAKIQSETPPYGSSGM